MTTKSNPNLTGVQELTATFRELRDHLISKDLITHSKFESYVLEKEPGYNTDRGKLKIYNVYYGRATSLYLLWILEDFEASTKLKS